jgi:GNAT superfamily N-acetyltransferase
MQAKVREYAENDVRFVISTWSRGALNQHLWETTKGLPQIDQRELQDGVRKVAEAIVRHPETKTLVATTDSGEDIMGYVCFKPNVLYFVFVKPLYRQKGVGKKLLELFVKASDATKPLYYVNHSGAMIHFGKKLGLRYNPYMGR